MVFGWLLFTAVFSLAQQPKPSEYEVQAAYLYNFGKFVSTRAEIAATKGGDFEICIIGEDPFNTVLDAVVAGETIEGKQVVARRVSKPEDTVRCRILYISSSEERGLDALLRTVAAGVLTVSNINGFSRRGGMIEFVLEANRIRFVVDLKPITDAGITVSSDLLRVALMVRGNPRSKP